MENNLRNSTSQRFEVGLCACFSALRLAFYPSTNALCHLPSPWYLHRAPSKWFKCPRDESKDRERLITEAGVVRRRLCRYVTTSSWSGNCRPASTLKHLGCLVWQLASETGGRSPPACKTKVSSVDCQPCIAIDGTQLAEEWWHLQTTGRHHLKQSILWQKKSHSGSRRTRPVGTLYLETPQ